jgi:rfaE bifunctional protein kinase chain/domain
MNVEDILRKIRRLRVMVLGDICLDRWCWYDPDLAEPSRETGIPRIAVVRTEVTPGAGGTVANNLVALGVETVSVLGAVGDDGSAWELQSALNARAIDPDLLVQSREICTFTYTKLMDARTGEEDRPRVDFINTADMPAEVEQRILTQLDNHFGRFDVMIVSDQAETDRGGVVTPAVRERVVGIAAAHPEKVVWVDSRRRPELFRHVVLKPNEEEAEAACRRAFGSVDYRRLFEELALRLLIVTRGAEGARVIDCAHDEAVAGRSVRAVDICGAGDSFSAGAACALAATGSPVDAVRFGNLVASVTVTKKGTGTASPEELLAI